MPPPGGPDDKTPPGVLSVAPAPGSVNHPVKTKVTIEFSEWVDPLQAERLLTLFPPLEKGHTVEITGKRLTIAPRKAFAESTTYHIEIGTGFKDLHGNSIGTPFQLVFSTGPVLDSGRVFGCVAQRQPSAQPKAALFRHGEFPIHDTTLLGLPSYLTQTDSSGLFSFNNIRRGVYTLIAFLDSDNDNRLDAGKDAAFASSVRSVQVDSTVGPMVLYPASSDTVALRIASVKALTPLLASVDWSGIAPAGFRVDTMRMSIVPRDSAIKPPQISAVVQLKNSSRCILRFNDSLRATGYGLAYTICQRIPNLTSADSLADTISFNGTTLADTVAPKLQATQPKGVVALMPAMSLVWSEPVQPSIATWWMADSTGDSVVVQIDTALSDTTVLNVARRLLPGKSYAMKIPASSFTDPSGNPPADSTDSASVQIAFRTISEDSICYSLSGASACLPTDPRRIWMFSPINGAMPYRCNDRNATFRFDSIPGAKGLISWFVDSDSNRTVSSGSLFPWQTPEEIGSFADTVEARAHWDIEGIDITPCEVCPKPRRTKPAVADSVPKP
jgi:hypothetical protein